MPVRSHQDVLRLKVAVDDVVVVEVLERTHHLCESTKVNQGQREVYGEVHLPHRNRLACGAVSLLEPAPGRVRRVSDGHSSVRKTHALYNDMSEWCQNVTAQSTRHMHYTMTCLNGDCVILVTITVTTDLYTIGGIVFLP